MKNHQIRTLFIFIVLTLALSSPAVTGVRPAGANVKTAQPKATQGPCPSVHEVSADAALEKLKAGNLRWQSKMEERNWAEERKETAECGQHPFAVVIACMDSRVPPELIFDRGLGEIFGVRVTSKQQKDLDRVSIANARFVHSEILRKSALREPGVRIKWGLYYLESG